MVRVPGDVERPKSGGNGCDCLETVPQLARNQLKSNTITRAGPDRPHRGPRLRTDLIKLLSGTGRRVIVFIFDYDDLCGCLLETIHGQYLIALCSAGTPDANASVIQ